MAFLKKLTCLPFISYDWQTVKPLTNCERSDNVQLHKSSKHECKTENISSWNEKMTPNAYKTKLHNAIFFSISYRTKSKGEQIVCCLHNFTNMSNELCDKWCACFHISLVELKVSVRLLHIGSVAFLKVLRKYDIPVLANCMHACFLANSLNL